MMSYNNRYFSIKQIEMFEKVRKPRRRNVFQSIPLTELDIILQFLLHRSSNVKVVEFVVVVTKLFLAVMGY